MDMPLSSLWSRVMELLKDELSEISYNTWILSIEPISLTSTSIKLGVPTEFNKGILDSRYSTLISNAVKQVTSKEYEIMITVPSMESPKHKNDDADTSEDGSNSFLNPKYTFDTFVIGNGNRLAHAASGLGKPTSCTR